jgi:hypothetical protein
MVWANPLLRGYDMFVEAGMLALGWAVVAGLPVLMVCMLVWRIGGIQ